MVGIEILKLVLTQIAEGLVDLKKCGYMHRDIKLDNIFCHFPRFHFESLGFLKDNLNDFVQDFDPQIDELQIKIGDFGFSREISEGKMAGTR
mmetsp:Transcript_32202/g.28533  ORF Transcript_32202/g.28533 Transcript_32202/m.28533 type:complete len:92 (+) Transcript_32202:346-621(+)